MLISLITVCFNSEKYIRNTIESVLFQKNATLEYIIVDGYSTDGTVAIIQEYAEVNKCIKWISEKDSGIYEAMNKGIRMATGDIIGILNSDDFYINDNVLCTVIGVFLENKTDSIFADIRFVKNANLSKTVRYYSSANFNLKKFKYGFMPAHPTFFTYKENFQKHGYYKENYQIAADYELLVRLLYTNKLTFYYLPEAIIIMRIGGVSTKSLQSNLILNKEIVRACAENGIKTNLFLLSLKYIVKIKELLFTRNKK